MQQQQIERDGPAMAEALARIYQLPWPEHAYPTHVVAYANWQGAFSFTGRLMVLSSNNNSLNDRYGGHVAASCGAQASALRQSEF